MSASAGTHSGGGAFDVYDPGSVKVRRLRPGQWAVIKPPLHVLAHGCVPEYVVATHAIALGVALALVEKPQRCRDPYLPERVAGVVAHKREQELLSRALAAPEIRWPRFSIGFEIPPEDAWPASTCPACGHGQDHHLFGCCSALLTGRTDGKTCGCTREQTGA